MSAWFDALPPITKAYMCALFLTTLGFTIGLVNPYHLALLWPRVIKKFEVHIVPPSPTMHFPYTCHLLIVTTTTMMPSLLHHARCCCVILPSPCRYGGL